MSRVEDSVVRHFSGVFEREAIAHAEGVAL
jgi:hypothetical protein